MIAVGPAGNCGADSGCDGYGFTVYDGNFQRPTYSGYWNNWELPGDEAAVEAMIDEGLRARGYYRGAFKNVIPGNGNYSSTVTYELCKVQ
uniref:hypothetical protein n=1 Tax=Cupriavidus gilardii TaxID=82541 RepID=UPI00247A6CAD|nr:hypothetical protein [Cupriavidus gilardii]WDE72705.1 hypothetical protein [Cupriavidus gilardii]